MGYFFGSITPFNNAGIVVAAIGCRVCPQHHSSNGVPCTRLHGRGEQVFGPKRTLCQSCGMPLPKDEKGGGTETNGSKSTDYCSHCYRMGQFTLPYLTVEEMVAMAQGILKKMHVPGFLAKKFTKDIPNLKRWSSSQFHVESETHIICTWALPSTDG